MRSVFSFTNVSIKRRIWVAVSLVSLIPIIVLLYYFFGYYISFWTTFFVVLVIFLGWLTVFEVFFAIMKIYSTSHETLEHIGENLPELPNEVKSLEKMINVLSNKVKSSFEQLQDFSQKTDQLNKEVSRKVLVLSTILQANDLFSKEAPAEQIIQFLTQRLKQLLDIEIAFCALKTDSSLELKTVSCWGIDVPKMDEFVREKKEDFFKLKKEIIIDSSSKKSLYAQWAQEIGFSNLVFYPVVLKNQVAGAIGIGNNHSNYTFSEEAIEVLSLFAQDITLIWEHKRLSGKIEELEIFDYLTGLYNGKFITERLNEEIRRSTVYQRPCGFLMLRISGYEDYQKRYGAIAVETLLKKVARTFKSSLRLIDIAGRMGADTLVAILIEKNKRQCCDLIENLKHKMKTFDEEAGLIFSVAENPIDGSSAESLIDFAQKHLVKNTSDKNDGNS